MHRDRQTLTAFGGIAAILIGSAMLLEDAALSFGPITAIIGGIAAIALAGRRITRLQRHLPTRSPNHPAAVAAPSGRDADPPLPIEPSPDQECAEVGGRSRAGWHSSLGHQQQGPNREYSGAAIRRIARSSLPGQRPTPPALLPLVKGGVWPHIATMRFY